MSADYSELTETDYYGDLPRRRRARIPWRPDMRQLRNLAVIAGVAGAGLVAATMTALQVFMAEYAGVFALVLFTAAVVAGLVAASRTMMGPGQRILGQAIHRALALGALTFLGVHILTEIQFVQKAALIDTVVPFLDLLGNTFYIGLGTLAFDLVILVVVTGFIRRWFVASGRPLVWKILHGCVYAAWPLAIIHGMVASGPMPPYMDWGFGSAAAAVALALFIRIVALIRPPQQRPRERALMRRV
jgi:DMSO/TMAO reductase YedYZ heme-binding membrane subunit